MKEKIFNWFTKNRKNILLICSLILNAILTFLCYYEIAQRRSLEEKVVKIINQDFEKMKQQERLISIIKQTLSFYE